MDITCEASEIRITEEFFHPSGPVIYTEILNVKFADDNPCRFTITSKEELRQS